MPGVDLARRKAEPLVHAEIGYSMGGPPLFNKLSQPTWHPTASKPFSAKTSLS